jgi:protein-S-isoprenylcysteine O-methyltransferase Ste14
MVMVRVIITKKYNCFYTSISRIILFLCEVECIMPSFRELIFRYRIRTTKILLLILLPFFIFCAPYYSDPSFIHSALEWAGYFFLPIGVLGRSYTILFISGRKSIELITVGPFGWVRNPLYVFSFFAMVGIALQSAMITLVIGTVILFCLYYHYFVVREEKRLYAIFKEDYVKYTQKVPRWFNKNFKHSSLESWSFSPKVVRRTIFDAALFFLAFPFFELIEFLQTNHLVPVVFRIW